MRLWPSRRKTQRKGAASVGVRYASSPLLAAPTPPWRSRLLVALLGLGSLLLVGRAVYIQIIGTDFYLKQGESRYARTLDLPAGRGRIIDRNGQILAASVPAPSIWAIPKDFEATPAQRRDLARLLGMGVGDLKERLADNPNFVWLRRQVDEAQAQQIKQLGVRGIYQLGEYKRKYPEGEAVAHVVGFTNVEDRGQEGIELAFQNQLAGRDGTRSVIRDRFGRIVEDIGESVPPADGRDVELSIDSKVQFFAYQRVRDAVAEHKAKSGSVVVLDVRTGEVLAMANYPSYQPGERRDLDGSKVRNRALTDTFEPGSTMKPFVIGLALQTGRVKPGTLIATSGGRTTVTGVTISDVHAYGDLTVEQVIQKSSNVGTVKIAMQMAPREMWELFSAVGLGHKPEIAFPGAVAAHRAGHHGVRLWPVHLAVPVGACLHRVCARRPIHPAHADQEHGGSAGGRPPGVHARDRARRAQDAAHGRRRRRHRPQGTNKRLLSGRQERDRAQAGEWWLRAEKVPFLVRRRRAGQRSAYRRGCDGGRAEQRQALRR
jgi:cell division protein FtsI (penicillin-binding protein 3)